MGSRGKTLAVVAVVLAVAGGTATAAPQASGGPVVETVAGNGDAGDSGDGGPAKAASLAPPREVVVAPDGTVYFRTLARIRAFDPRTGTIRTVAGTGTPGFSGDGGPAVAAELGGGDCAQLELRLGMAVAADGTLYFTDSNNQRVRAVDPRTGVIRTVAGTGAQDGSGDGGPAAAAGLNCPNDVAIGPDGTVYVADRFSYRIRAIDPRTGVIRSVTGQRGDDSDSTTASGASVEADAIAVGPDGRIYFADQDDDRIAVIDLAADRITTVGDRSGTTEPDDLAFGPDGRLYALVGGGAFAPGPHRRLVAVDVASGKVTPVAGTGSGPAVPLPPLGDGGAPDAVSLAGAAGVAVAGDGTVYFTDQVNHRLRRIGPASPSAAVAHPAAARPIVTVAGSGRPLDAAAREALRDDETGTFYRDVHARDEVDLDTPAGIAVDGDGTVYVADTQNNRIRRVDPSDGEVRTVAGTTEPAEYEPVRDGATASETGLDDPRALALAGRTLYFLQGQGADSDRVMAVDLDAGTLRAVSLDGDLNRPADLAAGADGVVYVADRGNDRICRLPATAGRCETVAGEPLSANAIALAPDGTLYAAVDARGQILTVDPRTGRSATVAGVALRQGISGDGQPATSAEIGFPAALAVGEDGTLYFADRANHRIRAYDPRTGTVQAVAGTGHSAGRLDGAPDPADFGGGAFGGDGSAAGGAQLNAPADLAIGPGGALYLADSGNNRIRAIGDVPTPTGWVIHPLTYVLCGLVMLVTAGVVFSALRWRRRHLAES